MFELWCLWILFTFHTEKWTLLIFYFIYHIPARQNIELHSSSAVWITYVAVELSFIGLIFLKLYISFGCMQIYFGRFALLTIWSDVPMPNVVAFTVLAVIIVCNFLIFCGLSMDGKVSKMERNIAEVLILIALLALCA